MEDMKSIGEWVKLPDGSWGIEVRVGGRGAKFVGRALRVKKKDRTYSRQVLGDLVEDFGVDDVARYRVGEAG